MVEEIEILGIKVHNYSFRESYELISKALNGGHRKVFHVGINAASVELAKKSNDYVRMVNSANLVNPDGISMLWASSFLGKPLKERVPATDLMSQVVTHCANSGIGIYLFGAEEDIVTKVRDKFNELSLNPVVVGYRNGYFSNEQIDEIVEDIADSNAKLLLIALPSPMKEEFVYNNFDKMGNLSVSMGVGGAFDVIASKVNRAPKWVQDIGFEWFYRMMQEPKRLWKRYLVGNTKFIFWVIREKFGATGH
ncbi:WecB/TagA/CpsF family glycosyltransferase [Aggregatimonas sangjinii]|nr:WecB/TagA/CpsF family glycosyltransferase [Aggregatimonas sangjinii]